VPWLQSCGGELSSDLTDVQRATDESQARMLFSSDDWADARNEAQGDLTGYLSKHHYDAYGGHWNNLVKETTKLLEGEVLDSLRSALQQRGWPNEMIRPIIVDLTRAVLECSYRTKFRKAPAFFGTVLAIYKAGHLPCGWSGNLSQWPEGAIIAY